MANRRKSLRLGPEKPRESPDGAPQRRLPLGTSSFLIWLVAGLVGVMVLQRCLDRGDVQRVAYSELKQGVREKRFERVTLSPDWVRAFPRAAAKGAKEKAVRPWQAGRVPDDAALLKLLDEAGVPYEWSASSGFGQLFWVWIAPLLLGVGIVWFLFRGAAGAMRQGSGGLMAFEKSKARVHFESDTGITFSDVAGIDEAVEELREIVEFLAHPDKFRRLGGKIPKGVLLLGPPGTGKTLLARAVAGEAKVPFFNLSGSEFVEMFVGVGAARVRDLFEQAQGSAPCIIFIDELDALGKSRGWGGYTGAHEEREQTLNQLLAEMDGFDPRVGLIVLAATNRPEVLDPALMRPGRFDRQVLVDRPDKKGRAEILKLHVMEVKLGANVDLDKVAARTPGFAGADLANVVNEAALLAARRNADAVELQDFEAAIERVVAGLQKKNRCMNPDEKRIVAHHEAGHALVALSLPNAEPVHKVSIIPHGYAALGYTLQLPLEDRYLMREEELKDKLATLLGGRAAEELVFGAVSTGASNDLKRATDLARVMVLEYGMSPALGPLGLGGDGRPRFLGGELPAWPREQLYSERTAELVDAEIKRLVETELERAKSVLVTRREVLAAIAARLLEVEVIEKEELDRLAGAKETAVAGVSSGDELTLRKVG
ncbi:MAG: ATP-dependent zinc metalloprotease FtsH [Deltaproteobacteria bacterium]|nr:ATP-dependent zinc metalloprotease FtsH [Deltaproteobacteria bacterium]